MGSTPFPLNYCCPRIDRVEVDYDIVPLEESLLFLKDGPCWFYAIIP